MGCMDYQIPWKMIPMETVGVAILWGVTVMVTMILVSAIVSEVEVAVVLGMMPKRIPSK